LIESYFWLISLGFATGAYATLIGAGGGFILAPILLIVYPEERSETIASISLAVVFFNALSGSIAYARARRIDYKAGLIFSIVSIPGAVLGALTTPLVPRSAFDLFFGILMILASVFLLYLPYSARRIPASTQRQNAVGGFDYCSKSTLALGSVICFFIGYMTSLLGVGGGFIEVPAMVYLLKFPVHIATATSQFIVAVVSFSGSATHVVAGLFETGVRRTFALAVGVVLGAQLGARTSHRIHGDWIIRGLGLALGFVGARLLWTAL
jgi:uncharacterized membrane protein YfcA